MLDNLQREIIPIQNLDINFLKTRVIPLDIDWINGYFKVNNSTSMFLDISFKFDNTILYDLEKLENNKVVEREVKEIPLSQVTRVIKSFYNKGNKIPNSCLEISFDEFGKNKKWFVIYGDSVKPKLNSHSYKAPAKRSPKKLVNPEAMF